MQEQQPFIIRPMTTNDLNQAMGLSKAEGWNQTEEDWKLLLDNPLNRCIVAEFKNEIVGTATALNFSNMVAWIGMVLVDKKLRGLGAGKLLLTSIIKELSQVESIKLDATPAGKPLYEKLGFKEELEIVRMANSSVINRVIDESASEIINIDKNNISEVLQLDRLISGYDRSYLFKTLLQYYPQKAYLIRENRKPKGYILGRDGSRFNYVGPVSARSVNSAIALISEALVHIIKKPVAIDVLADKEDLIRWLESIGFEKQRSFSRMYLRSNRYSGEIKNQYLISGPEFG